MATYYNQETIIYLNGEFVKAVDAKMDFYSQSLHYGYSVFEGIRAYRTTNGSTAIFEAAAHFDRLAASAKALNLPYYWHTADLIDITYELLSQNGQSDAYIRPVIYAPANMSFNPNTSSFIVIESWQMDPFLGDKLLRVMTSSYQRPNPKAFIITAKAAGHYVNSILASQEAKARGYDEALLLDINNRVAEAPGANLFYEKEGRLFTPATGNILPGITRATVIGLCKKMGIEVTEKFVTMEELKAADTAFFCGTAAEVIGIESIDDTVFPANFNASVSAQIQKAYKELVRANHAVALVDGLEQESLV